MMAQLIKQTIILLNEQLTKLKDVFSLSQKKQKAIIDSDIESLQNTLVEEEELLKNIAKVEGKLNDNNKKLSEICNVMPKDLNITKIIELAEERQIDTKQLTYLQKELLEIIDKQKELNKTNEELLKNRISYNRFMLDTFSQREEQINHTYGQDGGSAEQDAKTVNLFDKEI